jgi:hypothetical protein
MLVASHEVEQPQVKETMPKSQDVIAEAMPNLSDTESQELEELTEYGDFFAMNSNDYERTDLVYHHTGTGEACPNCQPPKRLRLAKQVDVGKMLENTQLRGVIEQSDSPWLPPLFSSGRTETSCSAWTTGN